MDTDAEFSKRNRGFLAKMMDVSSNSEVVWRPEELGAILRHQMSAAVDFDLGVLDESVAARARTLSAAQGLLVRSFHDLLNHPNPPLELLELTKRFAKGWLNRPDEAFPRAVATVLYYASIVVAHVRCRRRITALSDDEIRKGIEWSMAQPWLDEETRRLFEEGLALFDQRREDSDE